jgi:hypothetical protein
MYAVFSDRSIKSAYIPLIVRKHFDFVSSLLMLSGIHLGPAKETDT